MGVSCQQPYPAQDAIASQSEASGRRSARALEAMPALARAPCNPFGEGRRVLAVSGPALSASCTQYSCNQYITLLDQESDPWIGDGGRGD